MGRHAFQRPTDDQMLEKMNMNRYQGMQIKTTMRYHLTPVKMGIMKQQLTSLSEKTWRKADPSTHQTTGYTQLPITLVS